MRSLPFVFAAAIAVSACTGVVDGVPATPFRREAGMPHEPPAVYIGGGRRRVAGTRYTADWVRRLGIVVQSPTTPVPWPSDAVRLPPDGRISVSFGTPIAPDHVVVHAYRNVDARGEPDAEAVSTSQYDATAKFEKVARKTRLDHVPVATDARYIVVFAVWHVPLADRTDTGPTNASASWLFRLEDSTQDRAA